VGERIIAESLIGEPVSTETACDKDSSRVGIVPIE
jgi:hypothetical protein